jgi:hypothetical protein
MFSQAINPIKIARGETFCHGRLDILQSEPDLRVGSRFPLRTTMTWSRAAGDLGTLVLFVIADEKRDCKWLGIKSQKASRPFDPSCLSSRSRADPGAPLQGAGEANRKLVGAVGEIGFAPAPQART